MALLQIPLAPTRGTFFDYRGTEVTLSPVRFNPYVGDGAFMMDMSWLVDDELITIGGIVLSSGTDIVQQYKTPLPNLLVLSADNVSEDPTSAINIRLYINEA